MNFRPNTALSPFCTRSTRYSPRDVCVCRFADNWAHIKRPHFPPENTRPHQSACHPLLVSRGFGPLLSSLWAAGIRNPRLLAPPLAQRHPTIDLWLHFLSATCIQRSLYSVSPNATGGPPDQLLTQSQLVAPTISRCLAICFARFNGCLQVCV